LSFGRVVLVLLVDGCSTAWAESSSIKNRVLDPFGYNDLVLKRGHSNPSPFGELGLCRNSGQRCIERATNRRLTRDVG